MWFKFFTWLRIYGPTAFYMRLLSETFDDVKDFFVMFLVIITAFANIMYILNSQRVHDDEGELYADNVNSGFLNSWIATYTLGFGEFDTGGYAGTNVNLIWFVWFIGTFMISVTFLNMLIAIMTNTYDKVMESRQVAGLKERINIMMDYRKVVTFLRLDGSFKYMVILKPTNNIQEGDWDGQVRSIKGFVEE